MWELFIEVRFLFQGLRQLLVGSGVVEGVMLMDQVKKLNFLMTLMWFMLEVVVRYLS